MPLSTVFQLSHGSQYYNRRKACNNTVCVAVKPAGEPRLQVNYQTGYKYQCNINLFMSALSYCTTENVEWDENTWVYNFITATAKNKPIGFGLHKMRDFTGDVKYSILSYAFLSK